MNRRQFALILFALLIVGAAGLILINRNRQSWNVREARVGDKVMHNFRFNDVAAIHIKSSDADFNVVKQGDTWRVPERNDYLANYAQIKDLVIKMRDLKVVHPNAEAFLAFAKNSVQAVAKNFPAPAKCVRGVVGKPGGLKCLVSVSS